MVPRALRYDAKKTKYGEYLKCPECGKIYQLNETEDLKCLECRNKLENLEGFFERHPKFPN